jgi:signal transduction histidine kinase
VRVEVADTGVGFGATTRGGLGLANLRDRLRLLYGEQASLAITENHPAGTKVSIALPA